MTPDKVKEYIGAIGEGLAPLGEALNGTGQQVFDVAVRHSVALGIVDGTLALILLVIAIVLTRWLVHEWREDGWASEVLAPVGIGAGLAIVGFSTLICFAILRLACPEWYAASDLLRLVGIGR